MKGIFLKNIRLKILALAFSTALWFFVAGQSNTEVGFIIPIGFKGVPKGMVMTSYFPAEAEVRVRGPKLFVYSLTPAQIIAELDISAAREGLNTYRLTPSDIITPNGIEVQRIRPSAVDVRMEGLLKVTLPVKVKLRGRPPAGYKAAAVTVYPNTVTVSVTKRGSGDISSIYTRQIDLSKLRSSTSFTVPLEAGPELQGLSEDKVNVKVLIIKVR